LVRLRAAALLSRPSKRVSLNGDGHAAVFETIKKSVHHAFGLQDIIPFFIA